MKAAIFGAGNIGRGLVGEVLADCGYQLAFIDADASIVELLNSAGSYEIQYSSGPRTVAIETAINAADEDAVHRAVSQADVVATAVGPAVLKIVAPAIGQGLSGRTSQSVNVLACENVHPNSSALRDHVVTAVGAGAVDGVGFPNVVVDRIVPSEPGSAVVAVEDGFEFVVDAGSWVGPMPEGQLQFSPDLDAYKLRKLWLVNGLHVAAAYLGIRSQHEHIHEAMADTSIRDRVAAIGGVMAQALATKTDEFAASDLEDYCATTLDRFSNASLPDRAKRVARNPLAKLAAEERLLAPANTAAGLGLDTTDFADVIAHALTTSDPDIEGMEALQAQLSSSGLDSFLTDHCGIAPNGDLYTQIESRMTELQTRRGISLITEEIVITNPAGLHARPAAEIVEAAKTSPADVRIHKGDKAANAKSIMSVLALGANTGDTVKLTVEGEGADVIVAALRSIMQSEEH